MLYEVGATLTISASVLAGAYWRNSMVAGVLNSSVTMVTRLDTDVWSSVPSTE